MLPRRALPAGRRAPASLSSHLRDTTLAAELAGARRARALILNTPHNPTGKVFSADDLAWVADLAVRHDLLVITDEIYEHIVFDGHRHESLAALPGMRARTIVVNSISKTGNATGWRVGWVIAPAASTPSIRGFHDTMVIQAPTPLQRAAVALLGLDPGAYDRLRAAYARKRDTLVVALRRAGFGVSPPEGAYYLFARYRGVGHRRSVPDGGRAASDRKGRGGVGAG